MSIFDTLQKSTPEARHPFDVEGACFAPLSMSLSSGDRIDNARNFHAHEKWLGEDWVYRGQKALPNRARTAERRHFWFAPPPS